MGIDKFRRKVVFPSATVDGIDVYSALSKAAIQGKVYYVEGNAGDDDHDGSSWD